MKHFSFQIVMNDRLMDYGIVECPSKELAEKKLREHFQMDGYGDVNLVGVVPHLPVNYTFTV